LVAKHELQAIDNYFIEPYIIWGIAGMILFIPTLGIAKIIFDNVENLKPIGFLIGHPSKSSKCKKKTNP
jgi:predicted PurR-regulated permease PerM